MAQAAEARGWAGQACQAMPIPGAWFPDEYGTRGEHQGVRPSPCHLLKPWQDPSPLGLWLGASPVMVWHPPELGLQPRGGQDAPWPRGAGVAWHLWVLPGSAQRWGRLR